MECPDCPHSIGLHALDSRIVGCTAGNGSEEDPICGCRTLYGEGIATSMRSRCVEKVKAMRDEWRDKHTNASNLDTWRHFGTLFNGAEEIITALESVSIQEQEK